MLFLHFEFMGLMGERDMTLRIERDSDAQKTTIRLIGRRNKRKYSVDPATTIRFVIHQLGDCSRLKCEPEIGSGSRCALQELRSLPIKSAGRVE